MGLNRAAVQALGDPSAIVLLYDATTRSIGLRAATRRVPHAYPVLKHGGSAATVTVIAFAKHYGIDLTTTRSYDAVLEDGILVIEVDKGIISGRTRPGQGTSE